MADFVIDPKLGDIVVNLIERTTGKQCHIVLLAFEVLNEDEEQETIGHPVVCTSLPAHAVDTVITSFADYLKTKPDFTVVTQE